MISASRKQMTAIWERQNGVENRAVSAGGHEREDVRRATLIFPRRDGERYRQDCLHRRPAGP